ncbi:MAG: ATP-binding protein, partial [Rhodoferax sp.]
VSANVENFSRLLDQSISSAANKIDLSLLGIADQLQTYLQRSRQLDSSTVDRMLALRKEWHDNEVDFRVTDQDGWVRYGPGVNPANLASYADRPFFGELREGDSSRMTVSKPVLGKVSKIWVVVFARRYNYPDGKFAGVIAAAVPLSSLTTLLKSLDLGPSGVALLRDQDGGMLARYPASDSPSAKIGAKIYSSELAAIMKSGERAVTYHTKNTGDNAERVVSYRRLSNVPFHLIVGMGPNDYLTDWRHQVRNTTIIGSGFLLIIFLLAWGLWRAFNQSEAARRYSERTLIERDKALASLKDQSNLLSELVESLPYGLVVYDEQRVKKLSNSKFGEILKFPANLHEQAGFTFQAFLRFCHDRGDFNDGESLDERYARLIGAMEARQVAMGERRQADGAFIEYRAFPISNGWTAITYLDTSEQHRQQEALNETQARVKLATESAGIGIWELNLVSGALYWDAQQYRLHGMEPDSGSKDFNMWAQKVHPEDLPHAQATFQKSLETRTDFVAEFRVIWDDASVHHIIALGRLSFDLDGNPVRMVGTNRDKSASVLAANLLKEALEKAEQASVSKSLFLANMSHEIRTPMNAILGLLQLLQRTPLKPSQQDYVSKITGSAKSLLGLLNDILDFSKIEADKLDITSEPFDVDRLFQDVGVVLAAYVGNKPVDLIFDIDQQVPQRLVGDALRLRQVLVNLAGNAIKFTSQGQVLIALNLLAPPSADTGQVLLECVIEDTGIGIAPENIPLLFSSFSQAESTTTRRFGGTGLGLAICKKLVEMMGGHIAVTSDLGVGSRFTFQIPLPVAPPIAQLADAQDAPATQHKDLLLIDDNPDSRGAVVRMLRNTGWSVELASSCEEALTKIREASANEMRFAALGIDCQLRPTDGWDTLKRIVALHSTAMGAETRVIMIGVN